MKYLHDYLLSFSFILIIAIMLMLTFLGIQRLQTVTAHMEQAVTQHTEKMNLLIQMYTAARERSVLMLRMVKMEDPFERDEYYLRFNAMATEFSIARINFGEKLSDEVTLDMFERQGQLTAKAVPLQENVIDLLFDDRFDEAYDRLISESIPAQDEVLQQLAEMIEYERSSAARSFMRASDLTGSTRNQLASITALAILISSLVAVYVVRKIRADQRELRAAL